VQAIQPTGAQASSLVRLVGETVAYPVLGQTSSSGDLGKAMALFNQKQYVPAADAFERVIAQAKPEARLYYYAALANREAKRLSRARQLFAYIVSNFGSSQEGVYSKQIIVSLGEASPAKTVSASTTTVGKIAAAGANTGASDDDEEENDEDEKVGKEVVKKTAQFAGSKTWKKGDFVFSAEEIAREGANGIDQSYYPNCWFQAGMSALAQLPRGQKLLASMIRFGEDGKYMVRFPGDGKEYPVSINDLNVAKLHNKAVWASMLEYAQIRKFPDNEGAEGVDADQSRLEVGLGCITGRRCEIITPNKASASELASFIGGAVRSQNPITCATYGDSMFSRLPQIVISGHAYTIVGFEPAKNMIIIRNPHGRGSKRFKLNSDPQHLEFEQLDDGAFRMSISQFQNYFHSVARSFI
jgi:hypothetical protein